MIAEIYHKTSNNLEDELTGNFFGTMRYMSFSKGLNKIFRKYLKSDDSELLHILNTIEIDEFNMQFWKRSAIGLGEIDGYIEVENVGIGIEVKYLSGLSGANQLEREAAMIRDEWCKTGQKILIFVGIEEDAKEVYYVNMHKPCFNEVHLGYITWQDILLGLDEVETSSCFEEIMIEDLKKLLLEKGFISFQGFNEITVQVDGGLYYEFGE